MYILVKLFKDQLLRNHNNAQSFESFHVQATTYLKQFHNYYKNNYLNLFPFPHIKSYKIRYMCLYNLDMMILFSE